MGKLHELLSVEGDLSATSERILSEATDTFSNKSDRFNGHYRTLTMLDESRSGENAEDEKRVETTVGDKLKYVDRTVTKYYDALFQKECANQQATANLVVDGETIAEDVPATFLLGMETRLKRFRNVLEAIPTLRPGLAWEKAPEMGSGILKAPAATAFKTEKFTDSRVLYEATENHPAQIDTWTADRNVGRVELEHRSGMISPAEKSRLIARADELIRAVKRARQRANLTEVDKDRKIGRKIFDFILSEPSSERGQS